ncbi:methyl-accepting chemotaxis protein [Methanoplanus endosymbiosus]|uniref:Methyl-accepting chemotaxis protein n=1 Tax=Methanoplanus endosymbiosus TaxID=33865 RepID=A0A9E7PR32_9EURY|nr:methyl-accepting chemotaxis protein [Methanoplanus endosymbiosus]UUX93336.1 methyl-accepting chemotaxis protein [Methanoplanus endosymbiosus]
MAFNEFEKTVEEYIKNRGITLIDAEKCEGEEKKYAQLFNSLVEEVGKNESKYNKEQRESERLQKRTGALLDFNPQGITVLAADKHRIHLNKEYERIWRGTYDELMAKKLYDFDITITAGADFYASYETKKNEISDMEIKWPNREVTYLRLFQTPILNNKGEIDVNYYIYQDLTEQVEKMNDIKKLEEQSKAIVQENPMPIVLWNKDMTVRETNKAFIKISGFSELEAENLTIRDFRYINQAGKSIAQTIETKKASHGEATIEFPAGIKTVERYNIPLMDENGMVDSVLTVYNDITALREEINNSEKLQKRAEAFLKDNPQGITVLASDKHRIDLNKEYERIWRGTYDELMAKKLYDFDIKVTGGDDFYASYETKRKAVSDLEIKWQNGEISYLRLFQTPILDENGNIDVNYYIYQDLTEHTNELKEVQKLQKRADTFLKDNPQAITVLAPDKHRLDLNKEYERAWHGTYDELMAKKLYDFDIDVTGDDFYASYETKRKAVSDLEIRWPDQTKSYLRLFQTPILDENGNIDVNYYIYQDRTAEVSQNLYMDREVKNIAADLEAIAEGRPEDMKLEVAEADSYTREIRDQFLEITSSIGDVNESLAKLLADINALVKAGENGELNFSADSGKYQGAYIDIIEGVNSLLVTAAVPVNESLKICDSFADADFTARFSDDIKVKGDFLRLKEALNNIGINVSENVKKSVDVTRQIAVNSDEVGKGTDEVAKAAEAVANTSQKAADLTKDLLINIEDINRQIADLSASNEEIASTSQEVFNAANNVVEIGKEAQGLGNDANAKMGHVERIAKESVNEINELTEKVKEVSNVVKLINDITGQINLLALNAAIEAARAGEHGRGFAVVAGEVKNLAGEARAAADSIGSVVSMVQTSSEKTANAINNANNEIVDGVGSVTKTIEVLNTIIKNAGQVTTDIGEITRAIEDQANISNNVVRSVDSGTEKTKEVRREAEELAALAEEASASVEEIGSAIHEVNALVKDLNTANAKFKY